MPELQSTLVKGTGLAMKLAIRPPKGIVAGARFRDPLIVTFVTEKAVKNGEKFDTDGPDLSAAFVWLSLMSEDDSDNLRPHDKAVLTGRMADSVHLINGSQEGDEQMVAYAVFRDLAIQAPGRYCFAFHLIDFSMYDNRRNFSNACTDQNRTGPIRATRQTVQEFIQPFDRNSSK